MVSATSTTFLLLLILLPLRFSNAHNHHQGKKTLESPRNPVNVEIYHGVPAVADTDQRTRFRPGKTVSTAVFPKSNVVKSEDGITVAKGLTTKKWKAHCVIGNCNHEDEEGKGTLNVKHKVSKRNNGHSTKGMKMSGLVPLNADYYVPRPHPPKNN